MNRTGYVRALSVVLVVMAGFLPATAAHATSHPIKSTTPVVRDCPTSKVAVRPHTIEFACADGNEYLAKISWTHWTTKSATGRGILNINDCTPDCASGHFHAYKAVVVLTRVLASGGTRYYTRYSLTWHEHGKLKTEKAMPISL